MLIVVVHRSETRGAANCAFGELAIGEGQTDTTGPGRQTNLSSLLKLLTTLPSIVDEDWQRECVECVMFVYCCFVKDVVWPTEEALL